MIKASKTRLLKQLLIVLLAPGLFLALVLGYVRAVGEVYMVKDINPGTGSSDPISGLGTANVNGILFFTADDGTYGYELWKSDGTLTGTVMVKDIYPGIMGAYPNQFVEMNGTLYFAATDDTHGTEVWKSDGTMTGTTIISDIYPGPGSGPFGAGAGFTWETQLVRVGNTLYWGGDNGNTGRELWKTDGTAAGTMLVKDIEPGNGGSADRFTNVNGILFFTAYNGTYGEELWKSDGTATGTLMVKDINLGVADSFPSALTNVNGTLFFNATDGNDGRELWKSDGTLTGTVMITDINPGAGDGVFWRWILPYTPINNTIYFLADDGNTGIELWKSDGTMTGTTIVSDINPGAGDAFLPAWAGDAQPINVNGTLYFIADNGNLGAELWKSDGTVVGTTIVSDINPGAGDAFSSSLSPFIVEANGIVFFPADDGSNGIELWKSDGTVAGTKIISDINPGGSALSPFFFDQPINVNNLLFFGADDGSNGVELWALPLDASPPPPPPNKTYLPLILK